MITLISRFVLLGVFAVFFTLAVSFAGVPFLENLSVYVLHVVSYYDIFIASISAVLAVLPFMNEFVYLFNLVGWLALLFISASVVFFVFGAVAQHDFNLGKSQ